MAPQPVTGANLVSEGAMRVQLQQQSGSRTIQHASHILREAGGVTREQLIAALRQLRDDRIIPRREQDGAEFALANAIRWAEARSPTGVAGRFSKSFYFDPRNPRTSWRFDVEGLAGYNLRW